MELKKRIIIEIRFFLIALAGCTAVFLLLFYIMEQDFSSTTYLESMTVIMLVTYLIRFVFEVMKRIK